MRTSGDAGPARSEVLREWLSGLQPEIWAKLSQVFCPSAKPPRNSIDHASVCQYTDRSILRNTPARLRKNALNPRGLATPEKTEQLIGCDENG